MLEWLKGIQFPHPREESWCRMSQTRIAKWDNLKFLLIFLVVFGHLGRQVSSLSPLMEGIIFFIYLFHMPLFVFLSGYFSKGTVARRDYSQVLSYLLLYLFLKFSLFAIRAFFSYPELPSIHLLSERGVAWYSLSLACFLLMTMFLVRFRPSYLLAASLLLGCLAGYCQDVGSFLALGRTLSFYPFFLAGFYFRPESMAGLSRHWYGKLPAGGVLLATAILSVQKINVLGRWLSFLKCVDNYETALEGYAPWGGVLHLGLYALSFLLIFALVVLIPARRIPLISRTGKYTLAIYGLHYQIILILNHFKQPKTFLRTCCPDLYLPAYVALALVLVLVLSLPCFDRFLRTITRPPLRNTSP